MASGKTRSEHTTGGYSKNRGGEVANQMASLFGKAPGKEKENSSGLGDSRKFIQPKYY